MMAAKRMALVPADMLGQIREAPLLTHMSQIDKEMNNIVQNNEMSTDMKFKMYQDALRKYHVLTHERDNQTHIAEQQPPLAAAAAAQPGAAAARSAAAARTPGAKRVPTDALLRDLPKQKKKNAKLLMEGLERMPELSLSDKNEIRINGDTIENSNIYDLVSDLTRDRKHNVPPPRGHQQLMTLIRQHNLPMLAIGNQQRRNALYTPPSPGVVARRGRRLPSEEEEEEEEEAEREWSTPARPPKTPRRRGRLVAGSSASSPSPALKGFRGHGGGITKWQHL